MTLTETSRCVYFVFEECSSFAHKIWSHRQKSTNSLCRIISYLQLDQKWL